MDEQINAYSASPCGPISVPLTNGTIGVELSAVTDTTTRHVGASTMLRVVDLSVTLSDLLFEPMRCVLERSTVLDPRHLESVLFSVLVAFMLIVSPLGVGEALLDGADVHEPPLLDKLGDRRETDTVIKLGEMN